MDGEVVAGHGDVDDGGAGVDEAEIQGGQRLGVEEECFYAMLILATGFPFGSAISETSHLEGWW